MHKRTLVLLLLPLIGLGCNTDGLNLAVRYDKVHGLQKNDPVVFKQKPIGIVTDVSPRDTGDHLVAITIKKDAAAAVTERSRFYIADDPAHKGRMAVEMVQIRPGGSRLKNRTTVEGSTRPSAFFDQIIGGLEQGLENIKKEFKQFSEELSNVPESEAFKTLENELKHMTNEIERSGTAARKKIEQQWLPRIKQELEALKERLRKLGREDELKPLEIEFENIKKSL